MAVTFPEIAIAAYMGFWDESAGTYTTRNLTTGDYFDDDAVVDDFVLVTGASNYFDTFFGIYFYVGTPLVADSITLAWEYNSGINTWTALPEVVDGTKSFTQAGGHWVMFKLPSDWRYGGITPAPGANRFWIRARITAVTNISEGGANATNPVQTKRPKVEVDGYSSGTPCTIADIETADLAGTRLLADALPCTAAMLCLDPYHPGGAGQRLIFTLAGTSAGAGDTIDITGTGTESQALTESIDVSGGNGTYTSVNSYLTVTSFDCTGWADGTVKVEQGRWGAAWRPHVHTLIIERAHFMVEATGYFEMDGEILIIHKPFYRGQNALRINGWAELTDSVLAVHSGASANSAYYTYYLSVDVNLIRTLMCAVGTDKTGTYPTFDPAIAMTRAMMRVGGYTRVHTAMQNISECLTDIGLWVGSDPTPGVDVYDLNDSIFPGTLYLRSIAANGYATVRDGSVGTVAAHAGFGVGATVYLINLVSTDWCSSGIQGSDPTSQVHRQYELDVHVADVDGNNIVSVTVLLEDVNGVQVFSLLTDVNGDIVTTAVSYAIMTADTDTWADKFPFKLTVSKAGYDADVSYLTLDEKTKQEVVLEYPVFRTEPINALLEDGEQISASLDGGAIVAVLEADASLSAVLYTGEEIAATLEEAEEIIGEL